MSTLQDLTKEIADLIKTSANDQREAVLGIGAKVHEYVVTYAEKVSDPAAMKKARLKAIKVLAEDIAKAAPRQTFDVHRAYQVWGVTKVYGKDSAAWSYSVLKEIAPTIVFDGEWKMKGAVKQEKVTASVNKIGEPQPTVAATRQAIAGLIQKRKSPEKIAAKPDPTIIKTMPLKVEPVRDEAKPAEPPAVKVERPPTKAEITKESLASTIKSGTIASDALMALRDAPDRAYSFKEFGKNLDRDEIVAIVQAISQFEESWIWLKQACKAEHAAREKR